MLSMGVGQGDSIELLAEGPDEQQAVEALAALVESGFGEDPRRPLPPDLKDMTKLLRS